MSILITSDLHFNHDKPFCWEKRGYHNVEEMNEDIVLKWNEKVKDDDTVFVLGDLILGAVGNGIHYINRLNGEIDLIIGNHDTSEKLLAYKELSNVKIIGHSIPIESGRFRFYLSHYPTICTPSDVVKERPSNILWNLCGHTHTTNPFNDIDKGYIYHCEVDAHHMAPVSLNDIKAELIDFYCTKKNKF